MVCMGITGGIGSGKTYIARIFEALGAPCYYSDDQTKLLYNSHKGLQESLNKLLGENVYKDGQLNSTLMASLIFNNKPLLEKVNALVHPLVWLHFKQWEAKQTAPYVLFESAILLEVFPPLPMDKVLTVSSPIDLRIWRVCDRSGAQREDVMSRIQRQWTDEQRENKADYVIVSDEKQALLPRVLTVHEQMLRFCNTK